MDETVTTKARRETNKASSMIKVCSSPIESAAAWLLMEKPIINDSNLACSPTVNGSLKSRGMQLELQGSLADQDSACEDDYENTFLDRICFSGELSDDGMMLPAPALVSQEDTTAAYPPTVLDTIPAITYITPSSLTASTSVQSFKELQKAFEEEAIPSSPVPKNAESCTEIQKICYERNPVEHLDFSRLDTMFCFASDYGLYEPKHQASEDQNLYSRLKSTTIQPTKMEQIRRGNNDQLRLWQKRTTKDLVQDKSFEMHDETLLATPSFETMKAENTTLRRAFRYAQSRQALFGKHNKSSLDRSPSTSGQSADREELP